MMQFSKTDQFGRGKIISISDELSALLDEWQAIAGSGNILRGLTPDLALNDKLCHASVNNILKRLQAEAELDIEPSLSGHSFVSAVKTTHLPLTVLRHFF
jgi:integrase